MRTVAALLGGMRRYRGGMNDPTGHKGPVDLVFDVAVYAPVGLAYALADLVPELARRGRDRLGPQLSLARSVGQFAVNRGAHQARAVVEGMAGPAGGVFRSLPRVPWPFGTAAASGPRTATAAAGAGTVVDAAPPPADVARPGGPPPAGAPTTSGSISGDDAIRVGGPSGATARPGPSSAKPAPAVTDLAIPSYDSLSAPQVVQRLAGLSHDEVQAVRAYEAATRGRRTIIARADQLLA